MARDLNMGKSFKALSLILGVGLLVWMVRKIGLHEVLASFQAIGWKMMWPILLMAPTYLFYAYSWDLFLDRFEHVPSSLWNLLKIKIAGEGANTLTPLNFVGGDPVRIWLLSKSVPVEIGGASVAVDRTLHSLATVAVIFVGIVAAVFKMDLPHYASFLLECTAAGILFFDSLFSFFSDSRAFRQDCATSSEIKN
ncbi:MAG: flippase-like domain-containing protein [Deltaproteobacteria bacterium]|nr:MAG: flippase-like domain-containing protein [Deltaproteobacteria bacterium]